MRIENKERLEGKKIERKIKRGSEGSQRKEINVACLCGVEFGTNGSVMINLQQRGGV